MSATEQTTDTRQAALDAIDAARDTILRVADTIHANPELGFEEHMASKLLCDTIETFGFDVERGAGGVETAFVAKKGDGDGPVIGILAEYDALPNLGHGCGHNLLAGSTLAAAIGLGAVIDQLGGQVQYIGTPAEEGGGGKCLLIDAGVFEGVDVALSSHHTGDETSVAVEPMEGTCLAVAHRNFEFFGKTAHAAADPHEGVNALNAVIHLFTGLDALRQHVTPDVRIHGIITHGGDAPNVVPGYAAATFLFRAGKRETVEDLVRKAEAIANGAALMTGATVKISAASPDYADMRPSYTIGKVLQAQLPVVDLPEQPARAAKEPQNGPGSYSTDLGNVSHVCPTATISFAISETPIRGHSQEVVDASISDLGRDNAIKTGKGLALGAIELLQNTDLLKQAQDEHKAAMAK
jgi:amidohydrolase